VLLLNYSIEQLMGEKTVLKKKLMKLPLRHS
jgi:hypothetical protein